MTISTWRSVGGLDPSLSNFGMCKGVALTSDDLTYTSIQIDEIRLVTTKSDTSTQFKNMDDIRRAQELGKAMMSFFEMVDTIYVELPVGSQSARAMASYGICIGVCAVLGKRLVRVSAKQVKEIATNDPEATKKDMINWAYNKYPNLPWLRRKLKGQSVLTNANEHVADSIAAIHAGLGIK